MWSRLLASDPRRLGLGVFAVALAIRVLYLIDIAANPFFTVPVIDAEFYHQMAQQMAGVGLGRAPFQMPPLYPFVLSLLYRIVGPNLVAAHVLQILLGAGSAALTFALGRRLGGAGIGLVAAAFVATSKFLLFQEGDLLATPLCIFLDLAALWFLMRWVQEGEKRRDLFAAGVALGLSAVALPLVLIVVPAFVVWIARRRRGVAVALLLLGIALPIAPVTLRNLRASGELVWISANGGINFWMGNNPDARRTAALRPGPEWRAMQERPLREAGIVESSARDRWFLSQGLRYWIASPGRALAATVQKAMLLVHSHEIMRDFDFYYFRDHFSRLLRFPGWNFAVLLGLAAAGLAAKRRRVPAETVLVLFATCYAIGITLFFVTARYRAPLVPVLAIWAAFGVLGLVDGVRRRAWNAIAPAAAVGTAVFVISSIDFFAVDRIDTAEAAYRVATTLEKRGQFQPAMLAYDDVLRQAPDHALAAARAAVSAQMLGRTQEAVDRYEALLERHPDYVEAAVNLANLAAAAGDRDAAAFYFEHALEIDPYLPQAYASYGVFLLQGGEAPAARAAFEKALQYDPTWEALRLDYARALLACGDVVAAAREVERAAAILPPSDRLELVRGDVAAARGDTAAARQAWERGLRLGPQNAELRQRLSGAGAAP